MPVKADPIKLLCSALTKFLAGLVLAGTLHYANGWLLIGLLFVPMLLLGVVLLLKAPELLEKRLIPFVW